MNRFSPMKNTTVLKSQNQGKVPNYKYELKDLFKSRPSFDAPLMNFSSSASPHKRYGKKNLEQVISKAIINSSHFGFNHFWKHV